MVLVRLPSSFFFSYYVPNVSITGWAVPFIWAGAWTAITVPWVHSSLHKEHVEWEAEHGTKKADGELPEPSPSERGEEKEQGQADV